MQSSRSNFSSSSFSSLINPTLKLDCVTSHSKSQSSSYQSRLSINKMSKISNENSQPESEPATKRFANQNENEINLIAEQKLQAARTALNRLDYKNTQQICTEVSIRLTD